MPDTHLTDAELADLTLARLAVADPPPEPMGQHLRARRREGVARLALVAADLSAVTVSLLAVAALSDARLTLWLAVLLPFYLLLSKAAGLYDRDQYVLHKTTLDEAPVLVAVAAMFVLLVEAVQGIEFMGRSHPLLLWGAVTGALLAFRAGARFIVVRSTEPDRVLVVGDAAAATLVKRKLAEDPRLGATVVGRVSARPDRAEPPDKLLGTIDELPAVLEEHRVERVIVAPRHEGGEDVVDTVRLATACGVRVAVLPRMLEVVGTSVEFDDLGGQVLLGVRGFGLSPSSRLLKRVFDIVVGVGLIFVLTPTLVLIALAVKLSSPGGRALPPDAGGPPRQRVPAAQVPHDGQ